MGKNLIQQKRGKGSSTWRAHGFNSAGDVKFPVANSASSGLITELITSRFHSAPLMRLSYDNGEDGLLVAPEGIKVGDRITIGSGDIVAGTILTLKDIPEGTFVCNVEAVPGDGGKFVRGSGTVARVLAKINGEVTIMLPSKKKRTFNENCRACLGTVAGGGRMEKPLMRAGTAYFKWKQKNRRWPRVTGAAMNAVSHPFGGKRTSRKGRPTIAPRNAPPGRKVGMIRPRKTGRARGTRVRKS